MYHVNGVFVLYELQFIRHPLISKIKQNPISMASRMVCACMSRLHHTLCYHRDNVLGYQLYEFPEC